MKQGSYCAINAIAWVIILFLVGCQQKTGEEDGIRKTLPKEGDDAPLFSLKLLDDGEFRLADMKGKPVVLNFWASWCPPCRMSIPKVKQLQEKFKDSKVVILGINVENDAGIAANFARKERINYAILTGNEKVERAYRVSGIPAFLVIDTEGRIVKRYDGYFPGMEKEWDKIITEALQEQKKPATAKPIKTK